MTTLRADFVLLRPEETIVWARSLDTTAITASTNKRRLEGLLTGVLVGEVLELVSRMRREGKECQSASSISNIGDASVGRWRGPRPF